MHEYIYRPKEKKSTTGNNPNAKEILYIRKEISQISGVMDL